MELRSDIAAAASRMTSGYEVHREIRQLGAYLREGETVHRLASGIYGAGAGLLAVTNHRVFLLRDGRSGQASEGFPLGRLTVVDWAPDGVLGTITISDSNSTAVLRDVPAAEGIEVVDHIRMLIESPANPPAGPRWPIAGAPGVTVPNTALNTGLDTGTSFGAAPPVPAQAGASEPTSSLGTGQLNTGLAGAGAGPTSASPASTGSFKTGPTSAGPTSTGSFKTSPTSTGPVSISPVGTGPTLVHPTRAGSIGGTRRGAVPGGATATAAYPSQYAPQAQAGELTRGAVPVSVLARASAIPAQHPAVEPPAELDDERPTQVQPRVRGGTALVEPGAERLDGRPGQLAERGRPGGRHSAPHRPGSIGRSEVLAGEVPVTQLAAETGGVATEPAPAAVGGTEQAEQAQTTEGAEETTQISQSRHGRWAEPQHTESAGDADGSEAEAPDAEADSDPERPETDDAETADDTAEPTQRAGGGRKAKGKAGAARSVGGRRPVRVEASGKPAHGGPAAKPTRVSRGKKWIWLGAGAAGLIGLAALGSAKLISTSQPVPAPVSPAPAAVNSTVGPVVTVTKVINGDTVEVTGQWNGTVEVLGILAPRADKEQCGASTAKAFAVKTLNNATVTLVSDPSQPPTDHGNRLAFLRLPNGADYSVLAVQAGMARYYNSPTPVSTAADIKAAEAQAQAQHAGLWGAPCYGKFAGGSGTSASTDGAASNGAAGAAGSRSGTGASAGRTGSAPSGGGTGNNG